MLSTIMSASVDAKVVPPSPAGAASVPRHCAPHPRPPGRGRIAELAARVLDGGELCREEALELFELETQAERYDLFAWANRIREQFKGNRVQLCSIVNAKAGGCPENCRFCAQSAHYQTGSPTYSLVEPGSVRAAADEAKSNGVGALASLPRGGASTRGRRWTRSASN